MQQVDHTKDIIELQDISYSYHPSEKVLDSISFSLHKGDYLGVIGPNGGGKTTLIKIMLGLLDPQRGMVKLFGQPITDFKDWQRIGYVQQRSAIVSGQFPITVEEVVALGRVGRIGLFRYPTSNDRKAVEAAMTKVDILVMAAS